MHVVKTRIAVVLACHNRRRHTLDCLRSLGRQASPTLQFDVHLLDDASTDGTADAVMAEFPDVHVICGTGKLFWGGGMRAAMTRALPTLFDHMLWLNDDVELKPDAVRGLLIAYHHACRDTGQDMNVIVGCMQDPDTGLISYSGFLRASRWHPTRLHRVVPARDEVVGCDTMNGNLVLVPRIVVDRVGIIDEAFPHQLGDIDYGFRVGRAGGRVLLAPGIAGFCAANAVKTRREGVLGRLRHLLSPRGLPLQAWVTFLWRYAGLLCVPLLVAIYGKAIFTRAAR
jgi:GT2 family glycosyltransferase